MSINLTDEIEVKTKKGKLGSARQIFLEGDTQTVEKEIQDINSRHNALNTKHESLSRTVQGIAVTGGASTATNVTYNNDSSRLNTENAQDAIDEVNSKLIYDVSACNGGVVFKSLSALLSSSNLSTLIPTSVRHGGMTIRFIRSSDNKYVQYRLMSTSFSTNEADWQGYAMNISDDSKFNSLIKYISVFGNVNESSKIELKFFENGGSELWVNGVSKGAHIYRDWVIDSIIEHKYQDVTIKFVPKSEVKNTNKVLLNNQVVLDIYALLISNIVPDVDALKISLNTMAISDDSKFNSIFEYFEISGNVKYSDTIKFRLYSDGGSELYVNGTLKGMHRYEEWEIGKEQSFTYNDVSVVFMPMEDPYNSNVAIQLKNRNVLFGIRKKVTNILDIIKNEILRISDNSAFNALFNYVYVYGNIKYTDKIEWQIWDDGGSELHVNGTVKGIYRYNEWEIGKEQSHTYNDVLVVFMPIKDPYNSNRIQLNNKTVLGIDSKLLQDIENISSTLKDLNNSSILKFACFGDSITSNQVSNIGGLIKQKLGINFLQQTEADVDGAGNVTTEFGNLAVGWSTMTDVYLENSGENQTPIYLLKSANVSPKDNPYNVLSNQIRRLIAHTTSLGEQVSWTVQSDKSTTTIPTEYGTGKGYTDDKPDIIYIASGINDATAVGVQDLILKENFDEVIAQNYAELKRDTMYSALRWAIETLQNVYPKATIFVATPLYSTFNSKKVLEKKCEIIKKMCDYMRVKVIDSNLRSGINPTNADTVYGGLHPNADGKDIVSSFVTGQIRGNCNIL